MIQTSDVGSLPLDSYLRDELEKFLLGANSYGSKQNREAQQYFEEIVVFSLEDKIRAGITDPCFPQFRDMDQMFVDMILSGEVVIPEVAAIKNRSKEIYERSGKPIRLRVCLTSPYTLTKDEKSYVSLVEKFGLIGPEYYKKMAEEFSKIVAANVFKGKYLTTEIVSLDDPCLGMIDDPNLECGGRDRESLISCFEKILFTAKSMGAKTNMHLHSDANPLFWEVPSLEMVGFHADDFIYFNPDITSKAHIKNDKLLKASIATTDFDKLIRRKIMENSLNTSNPITSSDDLRLGQMVADEWARLKKDPSYALYFLETADSMEERLLKIIKIYGVDRVPYAGPECGLKGFPSYQSAVEYLRHVAEATKEMNKLFNFL